MSTLRADGSRIEARIEEMKLSDASITYEELSARTADLGPGYASISTRRLSRARNGENVQIAALRSIARVLDLDIDDIVIREVLPDPMQGSEAAGDGISGSATHRENNIVADRGGMSFLAETGSTIILHQYLAELPPATDAPARRPPLEKLDDQCPYRGLRAFRTIDTAFFAGRDVETAELLDAVDGHQVVGIVAASGAGKSSLIYAGLLPALLEDTADTHWDIFTLKPGNEPLKSLSRALTSAIGPFSDIDPTIEAVNRRARNLKSGEVTLDDLFEQLRLNRQGEQPLQSHHILIFVDQWEELYTQTEDILDRAAFIRELQQVAQRGTAKIVLTLRADFMEEMLIDDPAFFRIVQPGLQYLKRMSEGDIRATIEHPAAQVALSIPDGLTSRMVTEAADEPGYLVYLQFTLRQLWEMRDREKNALTVAAYEELDGLRGVISRHSEAVFERLSKPEQSLARAALPRLVVSGERTRGVSARRSFRDFTPEAQALLRKLAAQDARLIHLDEEGTVEFAHEEIIRGWNDLQSWLAERESDAALLESLERRISEWRLHGERNEDLIPFGKRLAAFLALLERTPKSGMPIDAARYLSESSRLYRRFDRRAMIASLAVVAGVAGGLLLYGKWERERLLRAEGALVALVGQRDSNIALDRRMLFPKNENQQRFDAGKEFSRHRIKPFFEASDQSLWQTYFDACPDTVELDFTGLVIFFARLGTADGHCPTPLVSRSRFAFTVLPAFKVDKDANIVHSNFAGAYLFGADFESSNLRNTHFSCAFVDEVDFSDVRNLESGALEDALCIHGDRGMPTLPDDRLIPGCLWKKEKNQEKADRLQKIAFEKYYTCAKRERAYMFAEDAIDALLADNTAKAGRLLDQAEEVYPDSPVTMLRRAHLVHMLGHGEAAKSLYSRALVSGDVPRLGNIREIAEDDLDTLSLPQDMLRSLSHSKANEGP